MIKELWNVGLKVTDLGREVAFLREVGASPVLRERVSMVGEEREYAILMLARRPHAPLRDRRVRESCSRWRSARPHPCGLRSRRPRRRVRTH
jgi:hypothetical protein